MGFFVLMSWHLYQAERRTFYTVLVIIVAVLAIEAFYFERETLTEEVTTVEKIFDAELPDVDE